MRWEGKVEERSGRREGRGNLPPLNFTSGYATVDNNWKFHQTYFENFPSDKYWNANSWKRSSVVCSQAASVQRWCWCCMYTWQWRWPSDTRPHTALQSHIARYIKRRYTACRSAAALQLIRRKRVTVCGFMWRVRRRSACALMWSACSRLCSHAL